MGYGYCKYPTPVLNRKDFSAELPKQSLKLDELGLFRPLEFVAFENEPLQIIDSHKDSDGNIIHEVSFTNYRVSYPLYVDTRFIEIGNISNELVSKQSSKEEILDIMESLIGKPYVWGGNFPAGVQKMNEFYPLVTGLDSYKRTFAGVDCSGLLYFATGGKVPRNTSELKSYGEGLAIRGLSIEEILPLLQPLDMIVWDGHVFFILNENETIEARCYRGCVYKEEIGKRLQKIFIEDKKKPSNDFRDPCGFVIRRLNFSEGQLLLG